MNIYKNKFYIKLRNLIKKIVWFFGFRLIRRAKFSYKKLSFDDLIVKFTNPNSPVIFDVGAHNGNSIERYIELFSNPNIHSFEPNPKIFNDLVNKFSNTKNLKLNNFAFGDQNHSKLFNIFAKSDTSSFLPLNDSEWVNVRSKQMGINKDEFLKEQVPVEIRKLDDYVDQNKIQKIDVLKLDTQGYEKNVLDGAKKTLERKIIKIIETEIILDNVYNKYLTFTDIEKNLVNNNYRLIALEDMNFTNLIEGYMFAFNAIYIDKDLLAEKWNDKTKND